MVHASDFLAEPLDLAREFGDAVLWAFVFGGGGHFASSPPAVDTLSGLRQSHNRNPPP